MKKSPCRAGVIFLILGFNSNFKQLLKKYSISGFINFTDHFFQKADNKSGTKQDHPDL